MLAHCEEETMIDEALAGIVLFQHRDVWSEAKPAGFDSKLEHSLERREFAVDARVRRTLALAAPDVFLDSVGREMDTRSNAKLRRRCLTESFTERKDRSLLIS